MKKLTKHIAVCSILLCAACTNLMTEPKGNCVGILVDLSDTFPQVRDLSIEELKPLFTINTDPLASSFVAIGTITDLRYTDVQKFSIQGQSELGANVLERKMMRDTFYAHIDQHISELKKKPIGTEGSFVCYALSKMLWEIASCKDYEEKKVVCLSDLMEHTSAFSVYDKTQAAMLKTNPEVIRQILDREYPLPALAGIEIVFVHRPMNKAEDENYHAVSQFFKWYYEDIHKATVTITTNIPKE